MTNCPFCGKGNVIYFQLHKTAYGESLEHWKCRNCHMICYNEKLDNDCALEYLRDLIRKEEKYNRLLNKLQNDIKEVKSNLNKAKQEIWNLIVADEL